MKRSSLFILSLLIILLSCHQGSYKEGERLYSAYCSNCHMDDGTGLAAINPPLLNADFLNADPLSLPCIIRYGIKGKIMVNGIEYDQAMVGYPKLSDAQINNLTNYIYQKFNYHHQDFSFKEIQDRLNQCQ